MKLVNVLFLYVLCIATACNSTKSIASLTESDYEARNFVMEQLYDKASASEKQKVALRAIDTELVKALKEDLKLMSSQLMIDLRLEQLQKEENIAFSQILSDHQYEIFSIELQLLQQNLIAVNDSEQQLVLIR